MEKLFAAFAAVFMCMTLLSGQAQAIAGDELAGEGTGLIQAIDEPEYLNRMRTRGSNDSSLFGMLNIFSLLLVVAMVCFAVLRGVGGSKFKKFYDFDR